MLCYCFFLFSSFKQFLELEPQLRDILHQFYDSKYATCLKLLEGIKVSSENVKSKHVFKLFLLEFTRDGSILKKLWIKRLPMQNRSDSGTPRFSTPKQT